MNKEKPMLKITWDTNTKEIISEHIGEWHPKIPNSLYPERITWKNLMSWMETRVVPRTRIGIEELLPKYGVKEYNPYAMCKKSHGISMADFIWIRFNDEDIKYADIKIRD